MTELSFIVEKGQAARADAFLASVSDVSRSQIKDISESGGVRVNGKIVKASFAVKEGDEVEMLVPDLKELSAAPENIPIEIVFEDGDIAVINKRQGMVVHPAAGAESGTLVNALLYHLKNLSGINGVIRPGIVHRLDKNTSGLLVVAKTDAAHRKLAEDIADKVTKRFYKAIVDGNIKEDEGVVDAPVGRSLRDRKKMAVRSDGGRNATTLFKVLERFGAYTLVEFELKTGRTHQIRVHAKHIKHPVVGDEVYGGSNKFKLEGQLLHAYKLVLAHPVTGKEMIFESPLPEYFLEVLDKLKDKK